MKAEDITFFQTCSGCPESYQIRYENEDIGYLRLRWGVLNLIAGKYVSIFSATEENEVIWQHEFEHDDFKGMFDDDSERERYQEIVKQKLIKYYETK